MEFIFDKKKSEDVKCLMNGEKPVEIIAGHGDITELFEEGYQIELAGNLGGGGQNM